MNEWRTDEREVSEVAVQLAEFTQLYIAFLEAELDSRGRERFPELAAPTIAVVIYEASDGFVTFYLPEYEDASLPFGHGVYLYEMSTHDLDTICQSLHMHRLKVAPPRLGTTVGSATSEAAAIDSVPDVEPIRPMVGWFHPDVVELAKAGTIGSLHGMTVSPMIRIEGGTRVEVLPWRLKVWSPVIDYPGIGLRRLYRWTHADFWWKPENLDLSEHKAHISAEKDVVAIDVLSSHHTGLLPETANAPNRSAAEALTADCDAFLELLEKDGQDEEAIHQWLRRHSIFIDPHASEIKSKEPFGPYISDFVVRRTDCTYCLVEIEPATTKILRTFDAVPTAQFNHACNQVRDWQRYIDENVHTVREEQQLSDIYRPEGMVVLGRSSEFGSREAKQRWKTVKSTFDLSAYTYDELIRRTRQLAATLQSY